MLDTIDKIIVEIINNVIYIKRIIKVQAIIRGRLVRKRLLIPSSKYQTKTWRKNRKWYKTGKSNECEKYQIKTIQEIIKIDIEKTNERVNISTFDIKENINPMKYSDGFEWTEDFDGKITRNGITNYFNLKFVCERGGAQTRSLREVYHFINCQIQHSKKFGNRNVRFINILDGDESFRQREKFNYLLNRENIKNVFVGDLSEFQDYWSRNFPTIL